MTKETRLVYDVSPTVDMVRQWVKALPSKTGRSLDEWIELVQRLGPADEKARRDWLKSEYQLGTYVALRIAERSSGPKLEDEEPEAYLIAAEQWVDAMFTGKRSALRPIYERLHVLGRQTGPDVRICPCTTIVPFYRNHVFAQIKPATNARIDLGFALGDLKPTGRLIDTGGFAKKDRITHRIPITSLDEIDDEVRQWLTTAYDRDGRP